MNRIVRGFSPTLIALGALAVPAAAQTDVSGTWTIEIVAPDSTVQQVTADLAQEGSVVRGSIQVPVPMALEAQRVEGMIEGNALTLRVSFSVEGQPFAIEVQAEVDGDALIGSFVLQDFGEIPFTGRRGEG